MVPLHQVGKLDSWEDFQDRLAMTLFTTRSTAGTTEPMSSAPTANGICSLAISLAPRHGTLSLFGYCLMSNRFHLLLKPAPGQSISRILQSLTVAHTWRHHRRQGTSGHVWQGRFRSPVIQDGDHLLVALRYIEANPVRAAMVADPCESTWSSHRCHGAGHADPILDSFPEWEQLGRTEPERRARWRRKVCGEQPAKELDGVRSSVRSGRPYGAEDWVEVISHRLGIVREPRRRGRPPREKMLRHRNSPLRHRNSPRKDAPTPEFPRNSRAFTEDQGWVVGSSTSNPSAIAAALRSWSAEISVGLLRPLAKRSRCRSAAAASCTAS